MHKARAYRNPGRSRQSNAKDGEGSFAERGGCYRSRIYDGSRRGGPFRQIVPAVVILQRWGRQGGDWRYFVCAVAGMHALFGDDPNNEEAQTMPIIELDDGHLKAHNGPYDIKWWGRLIAILSAMVQGICTIVLWKRRHAHEALFEIDNRNALVAIGGLFAAFCCALIHICNRTYTWPSPKHTSYARYHERVNRYWAPQLVIDRSLPEWFWKIRTSLFWDVDVAVIITRLLTALIAHPYREMSDFFKSSGSQESTIMLLRPIWMFVALLSIANCWVPLAHSLFYWLHGQHWTTDWVELCLYLYRSLWLFQEAASIVGVGYTAAIIELVTLLKCPQSCTSTELSLLWKDPLENKLFVF